MNMEQVVEDPKLSDAALIAACRFVQEHELIDLALRTRWEALEQGWREHIRRHDYAQERLLRHDPEAASRVRAKHLEIATKLRQRAIDLSLGTVCADVAAKILLDRVIAHLSEDRECSFCAPPRRRRGVKPGTGGDDD